MDYGKRAAEVGCDGILVSNHAGRQVDRAKFGWVGRLWVWGLSVLGEADVRHVMKSLLADLDIFMNGVGFQNVEPIDRSALGTCSMQADFP